VSITTDYTGMTARVLEAIHDHLAEHGWPPSLREIGERVGLRSVATVTHHLANLERDGRIVRGSHPRQLRVVERGARG
jgi:repressor LexA